MSKRIYILLPLLMLALAVSAQKEERENIRKGNRAFKDSVFVDAEVNYRKALDVNPGSSVAMYNLGNALLGQQKYKEAMEQFVAASKIEKDKTKLGQIYHNMGVLFHAGKDFGQAIQAYKQALRNNPKDDETRYNLALAQKQQQEQQQNQQNQDQQQDQKKDQEQQQDQQQNQEDQKKDQQQEPPKPEKSENEMSKENAEQLLNSVMQDEKDVQDKVKKQQVIQGGRLEKDW